MSIGLEHTDVQEVHEHGRDWFVCNTCGAQWNEHEEEVSEGDGYCLERALDEERDL